MTTPPDSTPSSRQVIVTGATGFVGQHLIPSLLGAGFRVVAMARDVSRAQGHAWFEDVTFVPMDLHGTPPAFRPEAGAALVHLAWPGLPNYKSLFHFEENLPDSYTFVRDMVRAGVKQVMVTGTCFEYGMQNGPLSSSMPASPANPYALAKDSLRRFLEQLQAEELFVLQWARLFYMYGRGQGARSILAQLDAALEAGDTAFSMSGGEQLRDYLPVEEVATQLCARLVAGKGGTVNICSGQPISIRRLVEQRVEERGARITLNLGHYPYPDYEPLAFWGVPDPV